RLTVDGHKRGSDWQQSTVLLMIPIPQRFDFFDEPVDEAHAAHELVGSEVVRPDLDGNLDQAIAVIHDAAVKVVVRAAQNRARDDIARLAAELAHGRACRAVTDHSAAAPHCIGFRRRDQQKSKRDDGSKGSHGPYYGSAALNSQ